jgi:anti-sigma B factor antagonist
VHSTATRNDGRIKIFNLTRRVSDLLAITKVLTVFDVFDTEHDASRVFPQLFS